VNIPLLDLKAQFASIRDEVETALMQVVEAQSFIMGPQVAELEDEIASRCGVQHGIAVASGTDALLLALKCLDLKPGDEVITTPFTFFATAGAIVNAGGKPVFVDIEPDTFNIAPDAVEAAITSRTRAILPVHLYGQMARMERILQIAERHDLPVIEDTAQAIGARRRIDGTWRSAGTLGLVGTLSFFPSKNLGGWGDGGMVITDDGQLAHRLKLLRTHGGAKQYHHDEVGYNSRLDTLQAAVLLVKLKHLDEWNARRRERAAWYDGAFSEIEGVQPPVVDTENEHVYHQYTIRTARRDKVSAGLKERGVGCAVYYPKALHLQPCFESLGYKEGQFPEAERACLEVLSLPVYPELTEEQVHEVVDGVGSVLSG